jgi:hypothetical protein
LYLQRQGKRPKVHAKQKGFKNFFKFHCKNKQIKLILRKENGSVRSSLRTKKLSYLGEGFDDSNEVRLYKRSIKIGEGTSLRNW